MLTVGGLFSGIGGIELGLQRAGMQIKWMVEIDPKCQAVLEHHWPDVTRYGDVRDVGRHNLDAVDLVCGGFPCQPFSQAGKRRGEQDDHNLWPEMRRVVAELRPHWVIAENVPGIRNIYLDTILSDLESLDYTPGPLDIPAVAFGAPHIRHRLFIVAHANGGRFQECPQLDGETEQATADRDSQGQHTSRCGDTVAYAAGIQRGQPEARNRRQMFAGTSEESGGADHWAVEPDVGRVVDGFPGRVDQVRMLGNAVMPHAAEWLGRRILEVEASL